MVYLGGEEVEEEGVCGKSFPCFARTEEEEKEEAIGGGRERDMQRERERERGGVRERALSRQLC